MLDVPQDRRVDALLAVAGAVAGAHELDEVLEIAAEEARAILGVSVLSIGRWEAGAIVRTLINVGDLRGKDRWPEDETYDATDFPTALTRLSEGRPHIAHVNDPTCDPAERALMEEMDMASSAAVPIVYGSELWGELWAANSPERLPLRPVDVRFMEAICSQVALAIGRAELYTQLVVAAYRDPLTGLANRRAFDEALARAVAAGPVALILGDVDELKALNDSAGHEAGDAALRAVGAALGECGGTMAARIGGDEFCLILEGGTRARGEAVAAAVAARLAYGDPPVFASWGVAAQPAGGTTSELLRAADAAQYEAKRNRGLRARDLRGRRVAHDALMSEALDLIEAMQADPERLAAAVDALRAL